MMRYLLYFFMGIIATSCQMRSGADVLVEEYIQDLNRYENLTIPNVVVRFPDLLLPSYPKKQQALSEFDLGLLDFLSLQHCELARLVGNKNSILGRVMPNSQRLLYEVEVISALNLCEPKQAGLKSDLRRVAQVKRQELNKAYANAVFNSDETDVFFSVSNGFLPISENQSDFQELNASLAVFAKLGDMIDSSASATRILDSGLLNHFEQHFKVIRDSEYGGRLLMTLILLTDNLSQVAVSLSALEVSPGFCRGPMVFLKQKFKAHYIEKLQPYMARINQPAYDILSRLQRIQLAAAEPSIELKAFLNQYSMQEERSVWGNYKRAAQQHAQSWNRLLRECELF